MSNTSLEFSGTLRKHNTNPEQLVFTEKSDAIFHASESLAGSNMPSIRNIRLYLLLFSIELQFKRILLSSGVLIIDLEDRKKFGHQLTKLYAKCLEMILVEKNYPIISLFEKYNKLYGKHLRYYAGLEDLFGSPISDDDFSLLREFRESLVSVSK